MSFSHTLDYAKSPSPIKNRFLLGFFDSELNKSTHHIWTLNPLNLLKSTEAIPPSPALAPWIPSLFSTIDLFWKCSDCPMECTTLWIFQLVSFQVSFDLFLNFSTLPFKISQIILTASQGWEWLVLPPSELIQILCIMVFHVVPQPYPNTTKRNLRLTKL